MTKKSNLLQYIRGVEHDHPNWRNPYYAIKSTFSLDEISHMSDSEVENLLKLAERIQSHL